MFYLNDSINTLNTVCPAQFNDHVKCLDQNDYRIEGCVDTELNLITCWNAREKK